MKVIDFKDIKRGEIMWNYIQKDGSIKITIFRNKIEYLVVNIKGITIPINKER